MCHFLFIAATSVAASISFITKFTSSMSVETIKNNKVITEDYKQNNDKNSTSNNPIVIDLPHSGLKIPDPALHPVFHDKLLTFTLTTNNFDYKKEESRVAQEEKAITTEVNTEIIIGYESESIKEEETLITELMRYVYDHSKTYHNTKNC
jgi:hypothetical protein